MQAIVTKFMPATNRLGSRVKAKCERGSITISAPHDVRDPHDAAFRALLRKFVAEDEEAYGSKLHSAWYTGTWIKGDLPQGFEWHQVYTQVRDWETIRVGQSPEGTVAIRDEERCRK